MLSRSKTQSASLTLTAKSQFGLFTRHDRFNAIVIPSGLAAAERYRFSLLDPPHFDFTRGLLKSPKQN